MWICCEGTNMCLKLLAFFLNAALKKVACLIDFLLFYVPLKNFSLISRRQLYRWKAAKCRPMLGIQGLWAGRDRYCATPAVARDLVFSGLIRRISPFSRLLRHPMGCGGSILTRTWYVHLSTGTYIRFCFGFHGTYIKLCWYLHHLHF
jgi:hypothetical protein